MVSWSYDEDTVRASPSVCSCYAACFLARSDLRLGLCMSRFPAAGGGAGSEAGTGLGTRIEGSRDGRLVFHGTADGSINCYDLR